MAIWYEAETNYAGGDNAGAEYSETGPNADDFTRVNYLAGDVKLKGKEFKRNRVKAPAMGLGKGIVVTTGAEFPEIEFSYYLQTAADPFKAVAVGGTEGAEGTSYIFQVIVPDPASETTTLVYNIFGAQLTSYSVTGSIDNDKPPRVTVKFACYSMVINAGTAQTAVLPVTTINEWDDIIVTLDADPIIELKEFTLTILNKFTEIGSGRNSSFNKFKPLLKDKEFEYQVKFFNDVAGLMQDKFTEALNAFTCIWTEGTNTITVTECYVDSDNYLEYAGDDIIEVEHNLTIKNGNSVFT